MNPYQMYATDTKREQEGILFDCGDFRVRIARAGGANREYAKVMQRRAKPYEAALRHKTLPEETANELLAATYAEAVILGWESKVDGEWQPGIVGRDGKLLPPTHENITRVLLDLPDLFEDIQQQATQAALFRQEAIEDAAKN